MQARVQQVRRRRCRLAAGARSHPLVCAAAACTCIPKVSHNHCLGLVDHPLDAVDDCGVSWGCAARIVRVNEVPSVKMGGPAGASGASNRAPACAGAYSIAAGRLEGTPVRVGALVVPG